MTPARQWDVPHSAEYELKNARKHKSGLFAAKGGVQFLDPLKELTEGFGVRSTITTSSRFTPKESCRGAGKVEFEKFVFLVSDLRARIALERSATPLPIRNFASFVGCPFRNPI